MNSSTSAVGSSASAYTKLTHTRYKALDFIQSCKAGVTPSPSTQEMENSDGFKKRRRRRRRRNKNKLKYIVLDNVCNQNIIDKENNSNYIVSADSVSFNKKETVEMVCSNKDDQTVRGDNGSSSTIISTQAVTFNTNKSNLQSIEKAVEVIDKLNERHEVEQVGDIDYPKKIIQQEELPNSTSLRKAEASDVLVSDVLSPKIKGISIIKHKQIENNNCDSEKFGKECLKSNDKNIIIDSAPSVGSDGVVFENIARNTLSSKSINSGGNNYKLVDNNTSISCFSSHNEAVLKSYGDRFYGARPVEMTTESIVKDNIDVNSCASIDCDVKQIQKTPQFWPGQKRRSKRNKYGNNSLKKLSPKIKSEKSNSEISWLDSIDADDCEVNVKNEVCFYEDKPSGSETNEQLTSYKSRFSSRHSPISEKTKEDINWNNKRSECKVDVISNRIGINVNDLNSAPLENVKRLDSTKRSRRKAEPFDIDKQSDCNVKDLLDKCKVKRFYDTSEGRQHALDIPNSLCSFLTDTLDSKPPENVSRSLFSGSISEKGMYIPSTETFDRGSLLSLKRNSFQKIFECDTSFDNSDSGSDSDSASEDDELFDSAGDETDERGEGVLLPPEPQLGNVEYKLKLVNPTKQRFEHLVTQMKWRLREGRGEAVYGIGVRDCGRVRGLRTGRMKASLRTLRRMSDRLGAQCSLLAVVKTGGAERYGAEVLVRKVPDDQHNMELRVAVMGANDAGKSTLVGVLTQGELDNGRGSARLNMFRHLHEVRTGRTSSLSHEILGFDSQGRPIDYAYGDLTTPEEIVEKSSKLVSFIDLAGHRKYLKTTVQGLTGYSPHLAMLVISGTGGVNQMTLEHLALAVALQLPLFVVSTRADCAPVPEEAIAEMLTTANARKVPHLIRTIEECTVAAVSAWNLGTVPVFSVSSVSGQGLDLLRWFLYRLPPPPQCTNTRDMDQDPVEFQIDEVFRVGDRGGPVVAGLLKAGVITEKTKLLIGPLDNGEFAPAIVESMRRNRAACRAVRTGQAASLRLDCTVPHLRQGMVLLSIPDRYPHSLDISDYDDKYTSLVKTNNAKVCKEKILSESSHLWNSEKVSPKATKKMRRRKSKWISNNTNSSEEKYKDTNLNIIKEDSSTDDRDTYDELEQDGNLSSSDRRAAHVTLNNKVNYYREVVSFDKSLEYDKGVVNRITDKNLNVCDDNEEGKLSVEEKLKESPDHRSNLSILDLHFDKDLEALVRSFPVDDSEGNIASVVGEDNCNEPRGCFFFQAQVKLLHNSSDIYPGFQSTVHIGSIRQTAVIEAILSHDGDSPCVRAGSQACVLFRFLRHPEYLRVSSPLLFREGLNTKGVGHVTRIYYHHTNTTSIEEQSTV